MPGKKIAWTDELTAEVRAHWERGISAAAIAVMVGGDMTRNAVIGRMGRIGAKSGVHDIDVRKARKAKKRLAALVPTVPKVTRPVPVPIDVAAQVRLIDRKEHSQCPFPLWAHDAPTGGPDYFVCGAQKKDAAYYCDGHAAVVKGGSTGRVMTTIPR